MILTIDVPKRMEKKLIARAERLGVPVEELALLVIKDAVDPELKTGADIVAYLKRHEVIGSRPDIKDSQKHARKIREQAGRRSRN